MRVRLIPAEHDYLNDVQDVPRAFVPFMEIDGDADNFLKWSCRYADGRFFCSIESDVFGNAEKSFAISDADVSVYKKYTKRFIKNFLYDFLAEKIGKKLPYGSLTGVRPTKLYYELSEKIDNPYEYLIDEFHVEPARAKIVRDCVKNQKGYKNSSDENVALFVNIPFCPTRCSYCSFISTEIGRVKKQIPLYTESLVEEIELSKELVKRAKKKVTSIYVGGGTPPALGAEYLDKVLSPLKEYNVEFTVEAGRPDVITDEITDVLLRNNVTRVSVNPQTFKQSTLDLIGRKHTVEDIYTAYDRVRGRFDVNMDLIAGLPEESFDDFAESIEKTLDLRPENITVHTLSLKRGSVLTLSGAVKEADGLIKDMGDFAIEKLYDAGYVPYYMYRQKNMADNLENVGYCLPKKQCVYNVDMMEESISVIGSGAGAMSKKISGNRIDRLSDPKGFREYVERTDTILRQKKEFFSF